MEENCEFCSDEFEWTVIREYKNWSLQLFMNQYYLGRCLVKLKDHKVDLGELDRAERNEFFDKILPELKSALDSLFSPDLYNYCSLGNDCRHFHFHVIPRYSSKRNYRGLEFSDENWNSHYKPYPSDFSIDDEVFRGLIMDIGSELN